MKTFTISDEINPITVECDDNGVPRSASVHWLNNLDLGRLSDPRCQLSQGFAWSRTTPFSAAVVKVQPQLTPDEIEWLEMMCAETSGAEEYSNATEGRW